jgi:hypothetical protein
MRSTLAISILLLIGPSAVAHRLDEYLQATLISVDQDRIQAQIRLTPGVVVLPIVLSAIDTNADGVISPAEQTTYAEQVLRDLSLALDGHRLGLRLVSSRFPTVEEMKDGLGEIQLEFEANAPPGGPRRRLVFENHHRSQVAAYLVNSLVPRPEIRIEAQNRNYQQSFYQLDYQQACGRPGPLSFAWLSWGNSWLAAAALLLSVRLACVCRQRV